MLCFVLFCFFAALQFHEQKKYDLYVLSGSKFSAADLDKSYGYFGVTREYPATRKVTLERKDTRLRRYNVVNNPV